MTQRSKPSRCPSCGRRKKRTTEANARYWLLLHMISERCIPAEGSHYASDTWHLYFKSRFLGALDYELPNGKTISIPNSSADLSSDEFSDYQTQVEAWAAERGIYLDEGKE
jgi:hypothetical protein